MIEEDAAGLRLAVAVLIAECRDAITFPGVAP